MERVSVYIDGANFFHGIRSINRRYSDFKFDFSNFVKKIKSGRQLVRVYYYNASLKQETNPSLFKQQQKFFSRLRKIDKWKVILCKRRPRIIEGNEKFTIKGDDICLALDMLDDACGNKYDTAILISGDGDFVPLVERVNSKGKKVENYHFEGNLSIDLMNKCKTCTTINKKTVNRFFYRETLKFKDTSEGKKFKNRGKSK